MPFLLILLLIQPLASSSFSVHFYTTLSKQSTVLMAPHRPRTRDEFSRHHQHYKHQEHLSSLETTRLLSQLDDTTAAADIDNDIEKSNTTRTTSPSSSSSSSVGREILALAIPALGALAMDPLMTLADTAIVGRYATTPDALAGMASSAALLTFSFFTFNFFCTATTPLVGTRQASGDTAGAIQVGGQALSLSLAVGTLVTILLVTMAQPLLSLMGTTSTGMMQANQYALDFLIIRALAAPAVLCCSAATGVLRGYLDTTTPIYILAVANVVNFILDIVLIVNNNMGPMGAAIATTTAEWMSATLLLAVLAGKLPSAIGNVGSNSHSNVSIVPSLSIPQWKEIQPLVVASSSVFLRSAVLQVTLSAAAAMAARSSNSGGVAASVLAAHQIAIQLWMLCSFVCDALAAASQGLVADGIGRNNEKTVRDVSRTVVVYSGILGLGLGVGLQVGTQFLLDFFTRDAATQAYLAQILALIIVAQPLNSLVFAADGVLQGASEFWYQAKAMALSGATAWISYLILQQVYGSDDTLLHVWIALIALQLMRGITSFIKIVDPKGPIKLLE